MSRIGKKPVTLPACVDYKQDGQTVTIKGGKGTLSRTFHDKIVLTKGEGEVTVAPADESREAQALHGLSRTLLNNMVVGVTEGFKKELEINGVGYRCQKQGKTINLTLGFSHPCSVSDTADITIESPAPNKIIIVGIDKQKVGQFAAEVRSIRPPEPYKGKGIKYADEVIIRKEGKAGKGKK